MGHHSAGPYTSGVLMIAERGDLGTMRADPRWLDDELADWDVPRTWAMALLIVPVVFAGLVAITAVHRPLYVALVDEDAIIEWTQVAILVGIVLAALMVARLLLRSGSRAVALVYLVGVAGTVFIIGEEISWGQRILGWATPEQLAQLNQQGETNIHNIGNVLRVFNLAMMVIAFAAAAAPAVWRARVGSRNRVGSEILFVPPLFLASSFLIAFAYRLIRFTLIPEGRFVVTHYQEVTELIFYGAVLAFLVLVLRRMRRSPTGS